MSLSQPTVSSSTETARDRVRAALACPDCRGSLDGGFGTGADAWCCSGCGRRFAVAAGQAPVLLPKQSPVVLEAGGDLAGLAARYRVALMRSGRKFPQNLLPQTSAYSLTDVVERRALTESPESGVVLHLGCGHRKLPTSRPIVELDISLSPQTNVLGDAHALPLADRSVSAVVSHNVLEYLERPPEVAREIERVLMPGGMLLITAALILPLSTPDYHDRYRFTGQALRELFGGLEPLESGPSLGLITAFVRVGDRVLDTTVPSKWLAFPLRFGWNWSLQPLKYLEPSLLRRDKKQISAAAFYLLARKPSTEEAAR